MKSLAGMVSSDDRIEFCLEKPRDFRPNARHISLWNLLTF